MQGQNPMDMPTEMTVNGKTLPLWSRKQLESMSPQIMRMRGLDIKDAMMLTGTVPRHKETLAEWILAMQTAVMEGVEPPQARAPPAVPEYGIPEMGGPIPGMGGPIPGMGQAARMRDQGMRSARSGYGAPSEADSVMTDMTSYSEARTGAMKAKARNMGSGNILTWG